MHVPAAGHNTTNHPLGVWPPLKLSEPAQCILEPGSKPSSGPSSPRLLTCCCRTSWQLSLHHLHSSLSSCGNHSVRHNEHSELCRAALVADVQQSVLCALESKVSFDFRLATGMLVSCSAHKSIPDQCLSVTLHSSSDKSDSWRFPGHTRRENDKMTTHIRYAPRTAPIHSQTQRLEELRRLEAWHTARCNFALC